MRHRFDDLWVGSPYLWPLPCHACGVKSMLYQHIVDQKSRATLTLIVCQCGFYHREVKRTKEEDYRDAPLHVEPWPDAPEIDQMERKILAVILRIFERFMESGREKKNEL